MGRQTVAQGSASGRSSGPPSPLVAHWVSVPTICSLSPSAFFVLGERARVRGEGCAYFCKSCFEPRNILEINET